MSERTYNETCPKCGKKIDNIYEFFYESSSNEVEVECPNCEVKINIIAEVSYIVSEA